MTVALEDSIETLHPLQLRLAGMKTSLDDLILSLVSAVTELKKLAKSDEIHRKDEDSAWELLAKIEELFECSMTEDRVEGLLRVQTSILETLEIYGKLYDRQQELL